MMKDDKGYNHMSGTARIQSIEIPDGAFGDLDKELTIIKTKNGRPTVIEYDGHRYILQHPNHYGRS